MTPQSRWRIVDMIEVIQGEKQTFNIDLTSKKTGKSFDLTGNTEITVCFKSGTTIIEKTKTATEVSEVGDPLLGQITVDLLTTDTATMLPTQEGIIVVEVDFGSGDVRKAIQNNAFTVEADPCAT